LVHVGRNRPVRVVIVDDDPRVRAALHSFLSASPGFQVVGGAAGAATALHLVRSAVPDVVLVDVHLPDARDGFALLRAVTCELRIPAVAVSISGRVRMDALAAGAHRFIGKDSAPERLLGALRAAAHEARR
jgi:DNA-binding NarL/FixJ family response regulator